jgi:transcriptional regulator GlxA family with amidase domain
MLAHLHESIDLESIAEAACLSPFHFHRLFKAAFGMTPHEFLVARRFEKSRRLLTKSSLSMTEIAWAVGFESQASFSKFFTKSAGLSPKAFRKASA